MVLLAIIAEHFADFGVTLRQQRAIWFIISDGFTQEDVSHLAGTSPVVS